MTATDRSDPLDLRELRVHLRPRAIGDPDGGIPPGTAFEDIPKDWFCPVCGARTSDFRPLEPGEA